MIPVFSYLRAFTGRQFERSLEALQRGDKYRPMIRAKLAQHQLPQALEALPMAESAFRYNARSSQGAYGLWQFIPESARRYGLKINAKADERRDPARTTDAALRYLKDINKKFGGISILLSIAAYNAGEGRIQGVVRKSGMSRKARGYSRVIRFLPKETRGYVPEFLAAALILKNPDFFGFPVSETQEHDYVQIPKPQTLGKLANLTNLTRSSLRRLNPELKKLGSTPTPNFILRLPHRAALRLKNHLPSIVTWRPADKTIELKHQLKPKRDVIYTARTGNYLGGIADLFDVKIEDVRKWNNLNGNKIKAGQRLIIRVKKPVARKYYQIRSGDNLGFIARQLGVPIQHLMFINGMHNARRLKAGDRLFYYEQQA
ncbi:MAG: transglycosylase SLT domain-containing protein [Gammaproteobacteria bacterium]